VRQQKQSIGGGADGIPDNKYAALLDWMASKGAFVSDKITIQPSSRGGGYGAFVTDLVEEGELLFTIPRSVCVTTQNVVDDEACGKAFARLIEKAGPGGSTVAMAGFLAKEWLKALEDVEQGKDLMSSSEFGPYLATLPWERGTNSQEHILYWSDDDVGELLSGTMCYGEAIDLRKEVALATKVVNGIVGKTIREYRGEEVDSGFKWPWEVKAESSSSSPEVYVRGLPEAVTGAFVSLLTRSFQDCDDDDDDGDDPEKLVPLLDMLQHSDDPNISHAMKKDDGRTVEGRACRLIAAGEELLNQYRSEMEENMPYHRFFSRYGFVPGIQEPIEDLLKAKSSIFFAQKAEI